FPTRRSSDLVDAIELQGHAEGDGGEDAQLVRRVDAFDVEGRVRFRVAEFLGLGEHFTEVAPLLGHFGQDEVAGAVDDAGQPFHAVGREAFAQGLDDRDTARHGRLEGDANLLRFGGGEDFIAVFGDQRLVGGDYVLALFNGHKHEILGHGGAADQFHQYVDLGIA